jgi:hypothetical protein
VVILARFHGEEKIFITTLFTVYAEFFAVFIVGLLLGFIAAIVFAVVAFPVTAISVFTYSIWKKEKIRDELGALQWFTGFVVTKNGKWHYIDFALDDKEHINISDEQLAQYQKTESFKQAIRQAQIYDKTIEVPSGKKNYAPPKDFVDRSLAQRYAKYHLYTSRQIYLFELLRLYMTQDKKLPKSVVGKEDYNKKKTLHDQWKLIKAELNGRLANADIGEKTAYLEVEFNKYLKDIDLLQVKLKEYGERKIQLVEVEKQFFNEETVKAQTNRIKLGSFVAFIPLIISIILTIVWHYDATISVITIISPPIVIGVLTIFFYKRIMKAVLGIIQNPVQIVFKNNITKTMHHSALLFLKSEISRIVPNAQIYSLSALHSPFVENPEDKWEFIGILPAEFNDSFDFNVGYIPFQGYSWPALTTPFVMVEIAQLFNGLHVYLFVGSTFQFKNTSQLFYDYNIFQHWLNKIYLYQIATLQSKIELIYPKKAIADQRAETWKDLAITVAQQSTLDLRHTRNEGEKHRVATHQPSPQLSAQGQQGGEGEESGGNAGMTVISKKWLYLLVILLVFTIVMVIVAFVGWNSTVMLNASNSTKTTRYVVELFL